MFGVAFGSVAHSNSVLSRDIEIEQAARTLAEQADASVRVILFGRQQGLEPGCRLQNQTLTEEHPTILRRLSRPPASQQGAPRRDRQAGANLPH